MAVAYDAQSYLTFTSTNSWTHTPVGAPRAVVVMIAQTVSSSDLVSGVTYGGVAMTRVTTAADTVTEPGRVYVYHLGAGIPTGAQTVAVTVSSGTDAKIGWCVTGTAAADTIVEDWGVVENNVANPSVTLATAAAFDGLVTNVFYWGGADASPTATGSATKLTGPDAGGRDFGNQGAMASYVASSGASRTSGWTSGTDDVAMAAVAIGETPTGPSGTPVLDAFNRASGSLGAGWTSNILNDGAAAGQITTGAIESVTAGTGGYDSGWWNATTFGPNAEAFVTVVAEPSNDIALYLRVVSPGSSGVDGYQVVFWAGADTLDIYRIDNTVQTLLGASQTGLALSAGDMVGAKIVGDTITCYRRSTGSWSTFGSTRSDSTYTAAGYVGFYIYEGGTRSGLFDDFGGGTIASHAWAPPSRRFQHMLIR